MYTITFTYAWWWIPTAVTVFMLGWALLINYKETGLSGIVTLFMFIPALLVSMLAWITAAIFK